MSYLELGTRGFEATPLALGIRLTCKRNKFHKMTARKVVRRLRRIQGRTGCGSFPPPNGLLPWILSSLQTKDRDTRPRRLGPITRPDRSSPTDDSVAKQWVEQSTLRGVIFKHRRK